MTDNNLYSKFWKIYIYPTDEQKKYIDSCINTARYIYNWAVAKEINQYELYKNGDSEKQFLTEKDLRKDYKDLTEEKEWLKDFHLEPARYVISKVEYAYDMYFKGNNKYPKFKTKKYQNLVNAYTYRIRHDRFYIDHNKIRIEGFKRGEMIDCRYDTGFDISFRDYHLVNLTRDNLGNYFVSFTIYKEKPITYFEDNNIGKLGKALGIDLNLRMDRRIVCSDGSFYEGIDLSSTEKHINKLRRKYTRDLENLREMEKTNPDAKLSKRAIKNILMYRKANKRIHNKNNDWIRKTVKKIINKNPDCIVMETLEIRDRLNKNHWFAKMAHFNPLERIKEHIQYQCNKFNIPFKSADVDFKSSCICSNCGNIKKMSSQLLYICPVCNSRIDRDLNAAINLEKLAYC